MKGITTEHLPTLPLSALILSPDNARKLRKPESIEAMAASLRAVGMIQNVVVVASDKPGIFEVIAGGRRLLGQQLRLERGEITADEPIPYLLRARDDATILSLTENVQREAMHPADEYEAFARMFDGGKGESIDRIADAFGVTPLVVERRLALANAAPTLLDAYRADEISTDQLIALCANSDHERQVQVWNGTTGRQWMQEPKALRKAVLNEGEIDASRDTRIAFIGGLDAYRAAGGQVRDDLFTGDGHGGFITDEALLDSLVADKLEEHAATVRAEGWGWVELWPVFDRTEYHRFGRAPKPEPVYPEDVQAKVTALEAESDALSDEQNALWNSDDETEEQRERIDAIDERVDAIGEELEALADAHSAPSLEVMAKAGAVVSLENGTLRIDRGLVKAEDRKAVAAASGGTVAGGRETNVAGRKDASALSDALRRSLLGRRNHAVQIEVARNVRVAKVLLAVQMVRLVTSHRSMRGGGFVPSDLTLSDYGHGGARNGHPVQGEDAATMGDALELGLVALLGEVPDNDAALWAQLVDKTDADLDAVIAYGVAASVSVAADHKHLTGTLLDALGFDMAKHFTATADNYLGRVSKPLIVEALRDAGKGDDKDALLALKKGVLASEAETRLAGTGWVPALIRTPAVKAVKTPKAKAAKSQSKTSKATKQAASKSARPTKAKTTAKAAKRA